MPLACEISPVRADSIRPLPTGGIACDAIVARAGVFEYRAGGRTVREFRPPNAVFAQPALYSLVGAPVVVDHPPGLEVTTDNYRGLAVGTVAEVRRADGDRIAAVLHIHDRATIDAMLTGKLSDISPGYRTAVEQSPGVDPVYGEFDARTQTITFNHIALLPPGQGRQGAEVSIRLDAIEADVIQSEHNMDPKLLEKMIREMMPDFDALQAKVLESVGQKIPALVQAAVAEAVAASAGAEEEPAVEEKPAEQQAPELEADAKTAPPAPAKPAADQPLSARADARLITIVREVERVTGKPADLALTARALLAGAAQSVGLEVRADSSEEYLLGALSAYRHQAGAGLRWREESRADAKEDPADVTADEWNRRIGPGRQTKRA